MMEASLLDQSQMTSEDAPLQPASVDAAAAARSSDVQLGRRQIVATSCFSVAFLCLVVVARPTLRARATEGLARSPTSSSSGNNATESEYDDIAAYVEDTFDCAEFDDATIYTNASCTYWDTKACDAFCSDTNGWCNKLCGDACSEGSGAPCALGVLSNLTQTCATRADWTSALPTSAVSAPSDWTRTEGSSLGCDHRAFAVVMCRLAPPRAAPAAATPTNYRRIVPSLRHRHILRVLRRGVPRVDERVRPRTGQVVRGAQVRQGGADRDELDQRKHVDALRRACVMRDDRGRNFVRFSLLERGCRAIS